MSRPAAPPLGRVRSRWSDAEAQEWARSTPDPELGERIYTSRLLGAEPALVLCGGGNTSVKSTACDLFGERAIDPTSHQMQSLTSDQFHDSPYTSVEV